MVQLHRACNSAYRTYNHNSRMSLPVTALSTVPVRIPTRQQTNLCGKCSATVARSSDCSALISQLVTSTEGQKFGAASTEQQTGQVLQLVQQLKRQQPTAPSSSSSSSGSSAAEGVAPTAGPLSGSWRLLWTSEASVHRLVQGQLLGIGVRDIQQSIDLTEQRVTNVIAFALLGLQLQASGPLTVRSSNRIYYSFDKLLLRLLGLQLSLPLFIKGGGWTDCVVLQQDVRVMENSRRDTLVLQRLQQ